MYNGSLKKGVRSAMVLSLNAIPLSVGVLLTWQAISDSNNKGFDIERKVSSKALWSKISYVAGTKTSLCSVRTYRYTDANIKENGVFTYRVKLVNRDGSFIYSPVATVKKQ